MAEDSKHYYKIQFQKDFLEVEELLMYALNKEGYYLEKKDESDYSTYDIHSYSVSKKGFAGRMFSFLSFYKTPQIDITKLDDGNSHLKISHMDSFPKKSLENIVRCIDDGIEGLDLVKDREYLLEKEYKNKGNSKYETLFHY